MPEATESLADRLAEVGRYIENLHRELVILNNKPDNAGFCDRINAIDAVQQAEGFIRYHELAGAQASHAQAVPEVCTQMPLRLGARHLDAVRADPLCAGDDKDQLFTRLGWLVSAYDAIVKAELGQIMEQPHG